MTFQGGYEIPFTPHQIVDGSTAEILDHQKVQWKMTNFLAIVICAYYACYFSWALLMKFSKQPINNYKNSEFLGIVAVAMSGINICVNPFIYVSKSQNFRICLKRTLGLKTSEDS